MTLLEGKFYNFVWHFWRHCWNIKGHNGQTGAALSDDSVVSYRACRQSLSYAQTLRAFGGREPSHKSFTPWLETHLHATLQVGERNFERYVIQSESLARGPKLLSIKNYVTQIITWKFIYTYRERCKTGPAHNRCWNSHPFTSKHTWMRCYKFWNTFPKCRCWRLESIGV